MGKVDNTLYLYPCYGDYSLFYVDLAGGLCQSIFRVSDDSYVQVIYAMLSLEKRLFPSLSRPRSRSCTSVRSLGLIESLIPLHH